MVPEQDEDQIVFRQLMTSESSKLGSTIAVKASSIIRNAEDATKMGAVGWKRISRGSTSLRNLIDALGDSANEKALQSAIMKAFMLDVATLPSTISASSSSLVMPDDATPPTLTAVAVPHNGEMEVCENVHDASSSVCVTTATTEDSTVVNLEDGTAASMYCSNTLPSAAVTLKKLLPSSTAANDNIPTALTLLPQKGFDIPHKYFINRERAFDDSHLHLGDRDDGDEGAQDGVKSEEYFSFTKGRK